MLRFRVALVVVDQRKLGKRTPIFLVTPDFTGGRCDWIGSGPDVGGVFVPHATGQYDLVANLEFCDLTADRPDNTGGIGPSDVEVLEPAASLARRNDV